MGKNEHLVLSSLPVVVNYSGHSKIKAYSMHQQPSVVMYSAPEARNVYELQGMATGWCYLVMF